VSQLYAKYSLKVLVLEDEEEEGATPAIETVQARFRSCAKL
jgi:hypothetical protein